MMYVIFQLLTFVVLYSLIICAIASTLSHVLLSFYLGEICFLKKNCLLFVFLF